MKLIRLVSIILVIFFYSCKKTRNTKQDSTIQNSYQKKEVNNDNIDTKKDCVIYSDSIKIKKFISIVKIDLFQMDIINFGKKYNLKRNIHKKDKITLLNAKPELYFEK